TDRIYDIRRWIRERTFFDVLLLLEVPACLASLTVYFIDISRADFMMDNCVPWTDSHLQQVDIALNAYFFLMWFIRFLHADDVRYCLLHPYSFVFFCVVPPSFLSVVLGRSWSGLRFLRLAQFRCARISFFAYLEDRHNLSFAKYDKMRDATSLVLGSLEVLVLAAGIMHMLENSGDPFVDFKNARETSFAQSVLILLTMNLGPVRCSTWLAVGCVWYLGVAGLLCLVIQRAKQWFPRRKIYDEVQQN
ncbi:slo-1 protein, partial [Aphelenchoides avenae]